MTVWLFGIAAGWTAPVAVVHVTMGGRELARPLRGATGLAPEVRAVALMCWHVTSVAFVAMAAGFALAAGAGNMTAGIAATVLSAAFVPIGLAMARRCGVSLARAPQGLVFLPGAALGLAALPA